MNPRRIASTVLFLLTAGLPAVADEPEEWNFVRKHALALQAEHGIDLETAALRVFSNAEGTYGANVNQLMSSAPEDLEKLAGMARLTGVPVRVEPASINASKGT